MADRLGLDMRRPFWKEFAARWNGNETIRVAYGSLPLKIHSAALSYCDGALLVEFRGAK